MSGGAGWALVAGGVAFCVGGAIHPDDDPPGVGVKEHLRVLYLDAAWYPSHVFLLVGLTLMAAALVTLVRGRAFASARSAQVMGTITAGATVLAALGMVPHLVAAVDADRIAAGSGTFLTDVYMVGETLTVPAFGSAVAALAVIGALTRTIGDRITAAFGVVGGICYGLAGGTFAFTDLFTTLFPAAGAIGIWTIAAGTRLLLRHHRPAPTLHPATH